MLQSYLSVALRNLLKHPLYSLINIAGLAIGIAAFILILLFVREEMSYDTHIADHERIYRVSRYFKPVFSQALDLATIAPQAGPLLAGDFAEIEDQGRMLVGTVLFAFDDNRFYIEGSAFSDESIFGILDFEFVEGDAAQPFNGPASVVLTETIARRFFGRIDVVGEVMTLNGRDIGVTGVIRDMPATSHLDIQAIVPLDAVRAVTPPDFLDNWGNNSFHTYLRLAEGADIDDVRAGMDDFLVRHISETAPQGTEFIFQPITDIHLRSGRQAELKPAGSIVTVYTMIAISVIVLGIACINFTNLTTARAMQRAREVGVRKTMGASRRLLIVQFLSEAMILTFFALVLAAAGVEIILPSFNAFMGTGIVFNYLGDPLILGGMIALALIVGCAAGAWPAFVLSAFRPVTVLRPSASSGAGGVRLRSVLVVAQFAVSIALIVATGVVYSQVQYARNIGLGYETGNRIVLTLPVAIDEGQVYPALRAQIASHPEVINVTASSRVPTHPLLDGQGYRILGSNEPNSTPMRLVLADYDFFETYEMSMVAGRGFSRAFPSDELASEVPEGQRRTGSAVVNESGARAFGFESPDDIVGQIMLSTLPDEIGGEGELTIIGVAKDVYFASVHNRIEPTVIHMSAPGTFSAYGNVGIHVTGRNTGAVLAHIDEAWNSVLPDFPVVRSFLDDRLDQMYMAEERQGQLFTTFAALAILIACLGLFGLASFTAERRLKEIGVRKVMGASVPNIVVLLSSNFAVLVLIGSAIAWPVAWYFMSDWLENFAYRTSMNPLIFAGAAFLALAVALATIGYHAMRAASANPALSLRDE